MIISRTPYRISFFGGGTDYPAWYREEGGAVLSGTIDKYCYISCRYLPPYFSCRHRIVWSHIETVGSISEILHPVVRAGLPYLGFDDQLGLEIHHQGDLPARSGMGSSSAFSVGLIHALTALRGGEISKRELMLRAIELEQGILQETVGSQDQAATAYGGLNVISFERSGRIVLEAVQTTPERVANLEERLVLIYTGTTRLASHIARSVTANLHDRRPVLKEMHALVDESLRVVRSGDMDEIGRLLHHSWSLKRRLSDLVTNPTIDGIYETARAHGAIGGKLLGAGAAGFMVFYVPPDRRQEIIESLAQYVSVPFRFEFSGSTLIYDGAPVTGSAATGLPVHDTAASPALGVEPPRGARVSR